MAYITREDGERFVIPSYRDVISKRSKQLKEDIRELSAKYGEFVAIQRRGLAQIELAFSPDIGYLFGESVWHFFKRPADLIYAEVIPESTEAYFVIVKDGTVYLDGIFPLDGIVDELIAFTTQKNNFEIYVYGDVPICEQPEEGKVSFDIASVKSFNRMEQPLFQGLPIVKAYQLKLLDVALREHGIGVFPIKPVLAVVVAIGLAWMGYSIMTMEAKEMPPVQIVRPVAFMNPYIPYNMTLATPAPEDEIKMVLDELLRIVIIPGWQAMNLSYANGKMMVTLRTLGGSTQALYNWAERNQIKLNYGANAFSLDLTMDLPSNRAVPDDIYSLDRVVNNLRDRLATVFPTNVLGIGAYQSRGVYSVVDLTIIVSGASPEMLMVVASQLKGLPLVLTSISLTLGNGWSGMIRLQGLGS